jgi:hypothetical protein
MAEQSATAFTDTPREGPLGAHLFDSLGNAAQILETFDMHMGETYVLGDSPLVLLTALWSNFDPAPSSSRWVEMPRPDITDIGDYAPNLGGPPLRVFTQVDSRLLLEDLYAKLQILAATYQPQTRPSTQRRPDS